MSALLSKLARQDTASRTKLPGSRLGRATVRAVEPLQRIVLGFLLAALPWAAARPGLLLCVTTGQSIVGYWRQRKSESKVCTLIVRRTDLSGREHRFCRRRRCSNNACKRN